MWELPVRVYHWINAVALVVLCVTGYLIGAPIRAFYAAEAYQQYWFGWVRFLHFLAAFIYVFNFAARIYWGFVGNKYAKWNNFFPITKKQRQEIVDVVKTDVLQVKMHGEISTGHNSLAAFIYFLTFLAFVAQSITGFALYSSMSTLVVAADVHLDCAAAGRRIRRALLAPLVPVVLCRPSSSFTFISPFITTTSRVAAQSPPSSVAGNSIARSLTSNPASQDMPA